MSMVLSVKYGKKIIFYAEKPVIGTCPRYAINAERLPAACFPAASAARREGGGAAERGGNGAMRSPEAGETGAVPAKNVKTPD